MKRKRTPRHESVVRKLIAFYQNPENIRKPLKQAAFELGYSYAYVRECIAKYGAERFREERERAVMDVLMDHVALSLMRLSERTTSEDWEKFREAQRELREWLKVLGVNKQKIEHTGGVKIQVVHEVL